MAAYRFSDWKAQRSSWPKGKSCECIDMKLWGLFASICVSKELYRSKKKKNVKFMHRVFTGLV